MVRCNGDLVLGPDSALLHKTCLAINYRSRRILLKTKRSKAPTAEPQMSTYPNSLFLPVQCLLLAKKVPFQSHPCWWMASLPMSDSNLPELSSHVFVFCSRARRASESAHLPQHQRHHCIRTYLDNNYAAGSVMCHLKLFGRRQSGRE